MTGRKVYFVIQKLIGVSMILLAALSIIVLDGDATMCLLFVPLGAFLIFTRKMLIMDEYYILIEERRARRCTDPQKLDLKI